MRVLFSPYYARIRCAVRVWLYTSYEPYAHFGVNKLRNEWYAGFDLT